MTTPTPTRSRASSGGARTVRPSASGPADDLPSRAGRRTVANRQPSPGRSVSLGLNVEAWDRWRAGYNALRGLTIARAVALLDAYDRGDMAEVQWVYRTIERRNATLRALIYHRSSALLKMDTRVVVTEDLPAGLTAAQAEAQAVTLRQFFGRIDNLQEAIRALALAEFRGFTLLQVQPEEGEVSERMWSDTGRLILRPIHQWHWVRDGYSGGWFYNPDAVSREASAIGEERRADPAAWGLIYRECDRPINEIALIAHVRMALAEKDWTAIVDIFGVPNGVVIMPPGVPSGQESAYETAATNIASGGTGALPHGSEWSPNTFPSADMPAPEFLKYLQEQIVFAGTGSLLTMLVQSGSGTLAGQAHMDTFRALARAESTEITDVINRYLVRQVLSRAHPGQPQGAYWTMVERDERDATAITEQAAKLSQIGFLVDRQELEARVGMALTEQQAAVRATPADPAAPVANRAGAPVSPVEDDVLRALAADLAPLRAIVERLQTVSDAEFPGAAAAAQAEIEAISRSWVDPQTETETDAAMARAIARGFADGLTQGLGNPRTP